MLTDCGWGGNVRERIEVTEEKAVNIAHCRESNCYEILQVTCVLSLQIAKYCGM